MSPSPSCHGDKTLSAAIVFIFVISRNGLHKYHQKPREIELKSTGNNFHFSYVMPNPNTSTQEWYYHAPSKKTSQEAKEAPAPSQIPGLSNVPGNPQEDQVEDRHFRRKWPRDTDSKYIKLAKGGGRRDLLTYKQLPPPGDQPVDYPRVDWFDHIHPGEDDMEENAADCSQSQTKTGYRTVLPDWYVHDDVQNLDEQHLETKGYKSKRQILSFDNMSAWERDAMESQDRNKKVKLPPINRQTKQRGSQCSEQQPSAPPTGKRSVRLPKIEESGAVDFKHLMAMGYQRDWFEDLNVKKNAKRMQRQKQHQENEEKRAAQMRDAVAMRKPKQVVEDEKVLFKLSKFERVQPKVQTFRT